METTYDGSKFNWDDLTGTAYASELNLPARRHPPATIAIRSPRTGTVKVFKLDQDFIDGAGDGLTAPYTASLGSRTIRVYIYNDVDTDPVGW